MQNDCTAMRCSCECWSLTLRVLELVCHVPFLSAAPPSIMTKTQRRRTAGQRATTASATMDARSTLDYATATSLLHEYKRWTSLRDSLPSMIEIEFTSPFIDTELQCPEHAHLVVNLDTLQRRVNHRAPSLLHLVARALDAVGMLCVTAQRLSPWSDLYDQFWRRVIASDAMAVPLQPSIISKWVRYSKARGIPLLLSWSNKPFDCEQLMEPLRAFLSTPVYVRCNPSMPVTVGLRFVAASITTLALQQLHELLLQPTETTTELLIDPTSLRTLGFHSSPLYSAELNVLASMLADPKARRVDELKMEKFIVDGTLPPQENAAEYDEALTVVLTNALTNTRSTALEPPISLSLADNWLCDGNDHRSVEAALLEAITNATRPLCALSLAKAVVRNWDTLANIFFRPSNGVLPGATLNLTDITTTLKCERSLHGLLGSIVEEIWETGMLLDQSHECCFRNATLVDSPTTLKDLKIPVASGTLYRIEDLHRQYYKYVKITVTSPATSSEGSSTTVTGWVNLDHAVELRRAGAALVASNFTRLIYDELDDDWWYSVPTAYELTSTMGFRLTSLAIRGHCGRRVRIPEWMYRTWWPSYSSFKLADIVSHCPHLEQLVMEGTPLATKESGLLWDDPAFVLPSSLRVLDLTRCGVHDASLTGIDENVSLRYLSLLGNPIGAVGVESLLAMLRAGTTSRFVELNPQLAESPPLINGYRQQIDDLLGREYLNKRAKAAVLSVLLQLPLRAPRLPYPGNDVAATVFAFVGTTPTRVVEWSY